MKKLLVLLVVMLITIPALSQERSKLLYFLLVENNVFPLND
jgi:hypothetical protein